MSHPLQQTLDRISVVLGATPEQHATFEKWALTRLEQLVRAEKESRNALLQRSMELKQEYLELQHELRTGISVTGRTELARAARKDWLEAVLDFVEDLLDHRAAA